MRLPKPGPRRYSLKSLFLATTVVALVLGLHGFVRESVEQILDLCSATLSGESWVGLSALWLSSWYTEQIHKTLGDSEATRWVLPAKWALVLITLGATWAALGSTGFPSDFADGVASYLYVVGSFLLLVWMPRRAFFGEREASPNVRRLANISLGIAWLIGPLSLLVLIILDQVTLGGLLLVCVANGLAGIPAAVYLAVKVYEDEFSWPLALSVLYLAWWWAILVTQ